MNEKEIRKNNLDFLMIREATGAKYNDPESVWDDMKPEAKIDRECMWVLHLNFQKGVIKKELISMGSGNTVLVTPREIFRRAIIEGSESVILVHNHPDGDSKPSDADIEICAKIVQAGELLRMPVNDFFVISQSGYTSFANEGLGGVNEKK